MYLIVTKFIPKAENQALLEQLRQYHNAIINNTHANYYVMEMNDGSVITKELFNNRADLHQQIQNPSVRTYHESISSMIQSSVKRTFELKGTWETTSIIDHMSMEEILNLPVDTTIVFTSDINTIMPQTNPRPNSHRALQGWLNSQSFEKEYSGTLSPRFVENSKNYNGEMDNTLSEVQSIDLDETIESIQERLLKLESTMSNFEFQFKQTASHSFFGWCLPKSESSKPLTEKFVQSVKNDAGDERNCLQRLTCFK